MRLPSPVDTHTMGAWDSRCPASDLTASDACTAVFERLLEDVSRVRLAPPLSAPLNTFCLKSDELRVLLEGKLQRALNPLSASTSMLKMVTLTGLRYPHFRPRLASTFHVLVCMTCDVIPP